MARWIVSNQPVGFHDRWWEIRSSTWVSCHDFHCHRSRKRNKWHHQMPFSMFRGWVCWSWPECSWFSVAAQVNQIILPVIEVFNIYSSVHSPATRLATNAQDPDTLTDDQQLCCPRFVESLRSSSLQTFTSKRPCSKSGMNRVVMIRSRVVSRFAQAEVNDLNPGSLRAEHKIPHFWVHFLSTSILAFD